jgi:hypothetical protein
MFPEKPKRQNRKTSSKYPFLLLLFLAIVAFSPSIEFGFLGDSIAATVLICSAIYLVYQLIAWLIHQAS